jgi:hypothetical protein
MCRECNAASSQTAESVVWKMIKDRVPIPSIRDDQQIGGDACGTGKARPDMCWKSPTRVVFLEIDRASHAGYDVQCELKRLDSLNFAADDKKLPVLVIRFNPYHRGQSAKHLKDRCDLLVAVIHSAINEEVQLDPIRVNVCYLFYGKSGQKHIDAARSAEQVLVHNVEWNM